MTPHSAKACFLHKLDFSTINIIINKGKTMAFHNGFSQWLNMTTIAWCHGPVGNGMMLCVLRFLVFGPLPSHRTMKCEFSNEGSLVLLNILIKLDKYFTMWIHLKR